MDFESRAIYAVIVQYELEYSHGSPSFFPSPALAVTLIMNSCGIGYSIRSWNGISRRIGYGKEGRRG
jgi:hypothetical protein